MNFILFHLKFAQVRTSQLKLFKPDSNTLRWSLRLRADVTAILYVLHGVVIEAYKPQSLCWQQHRVSSVK